MPLRVDLKGGGNTGAYGNGSGSVILNKRANQCVRKREMPWFDGNNSDSWIFEAEMYFSFYQLIEDAKLEAAVAALEDDALLWYEWEHRRRPIRDWEELKGFDSS